MIAKCPTSVCICLSSCVEMYCVVYLLVLNLLLLIVAVNLYPERLTFNCAI
jgi:hypothetical protein